MAEALPKTPALTADRENQEALKHKHASDNFHEAYLKGRSHSSHAQTSSPRSEDRGSLRPTTSGNQSYKNQDCAGLWMKKHLSPFVLTAMGCVHWPTVVQGL